MKFKLNSTTLVADSAKYRKTENNNKFVNFSPNYFCL
ncbi:hypothetical protein J2786_002382 [Chryseobacterium vietnamense]|uniref:Uncharacterized protein n=1 Tax=Chryseobacterium vietnamense TaxID=866785 RepID=A0ACC6J8A1_9FLAO|nr:hypothetical protein [Chryseobacterium vietnamense]